MPNSTHLLSVGALILLTINTNDPLERHHGFGFGCMLMHLMLCACHEIKALKKKQHYRRCNTCEQPPMPDHKVFKDRCHQSVFFFMRFWTHCAFPKNAGDRKKFYNILEKFYQVKNRGRGPLHCNHNIGSWSCFGIVPPWV